MKTCVQRTSDGISRYREIYTLEDLKLLYEKYNKTELIISFTEDNMLCVEVYDDYRE
jgi:hypothetical protein